MILAKNIAQPVKILSLISKKGEGRREVSKGGSLNLILYTMELTQEIKCKPNANEDQKAEKQKTARQYRAFHLWLAESAQALRDGGFTLKQVLASIPEIEMTPVAMKEIWRQIQVVMTGKTSTKDLTTKELQEVYEVVNREILLKRGINIPFPSSDPQIYNPEEYGY